MFFVKKKMLHDSMSLISSTPPKFDESIPKEDGFFKMHLESLNTGGAPFGFFGTRLAVRFPGGCAGPHLSIERSRSSYFGTNYKTCTGQRARRFIKPAKRFAHRDYHKPL